MNNVVARIDAALGNGLERLVRDHHRRRLRRLGWHRAIEPDAGLWVRGDPPPREGNSIEVLIDGEAAFSRIVDDMRHARSAVECAGWHLDPSFAVARDVEQVFARDLLTDLAEKVDVRVLLWMGAPVPPPVTPTRRDGRASAETLTHGTRVRVALDSKERPLHCHHEKLVIVDEEIACVGGIDLSTLGGDRYDTPDHRSRAAVGWHDATTRLQGPIVADVARHLRMRWHEVTGEHLPAPVPQPAAGAITLQLVRTVPEKIYDAVPKGDFGILEAYVRALRSAERFVYLENQFLWSPQIVEILNDKLADPPTDDFRVLVVLPSSPSTGADDTRGQLGVLAEADDGAGRLLACSLFARSGVHADSIYVHAKIGIVDDRWITIGSANLNNHSLFNDTEVNVISCDADLARSTRLRLWAEHLETSVEEVSGDPTRLFEDAWKPTAQEQRRRLDADEPLTARVCELSQVSARSMRLLGPLQGLVVDG